MSLVTLILVLVILGVLLYVIEVYVPMAPPFKLLIRVVVVLCVVLWLLQVFGLLNVAVPRVGR